MRVWVSRGEGGGREGGGRGKVERRAGEEGEEVEVEVEEGRHIVMYNVLLCRLH